MLDAETQDEIFSITPPPSEFDEFDKSGLLTCSPSLPSFTYPSPAPSSQGLALSVPSDPLYMLPDIPMSDSQSHDLQTISFEDPSSDTPPFFPVSSMSDASLAHYTSAPSTTNSYNMYEQNHWYPYTSYSHPLGTPIPYGQIPFAAFGHPATQPPIATIIPPTPENMHAHPFAFNSAPVPSSSRLDASPAFSHISYPSRSSMSSLSRSCSPIPSLARGNSGESSTFRAQLRSHSTSSSTSQHASFHAYGILVPESPSAMARSLAPSSPTSSSINTQAWRCAFPGCTSQATFTRGCDLRKHYNRHSKHLFCRVEGCLQSETAAATRAKSADQPMSGGFSSKKDRARHEAKHNPGIKCEWRGAQGEDCGRVFSRMDNMKDHVRRIHSKTTTGAATRAALVTAATVTKTAQLAPELKPSTRREV